MKRGANAARRAECCKQSEKPAPRKSLPAAAVPHTHTEKMRDEREAKKTAVEERLEERAD